MNHQKLIQNRHEKTEHLAALIDAHLWPMQADGRAQELRCEAMVLMTQAHLERLAALTDQLSLKEQAYDEEQADDAALRGQIAEVTLTLYQTLSRTRDRIVEVDGPDTLQIYGMQERPPRARAALVQYCRHTINLMRAHPYTFHDDLGELVDTRRVATFLQELFEPLETLVSQMDHELDDLQEALRQRNASLELWTDLFHGLCTMLEGFFTICGNHDVAEQLKRLSR